MFILRSFLRIYLTNWQYLYLSTPSTLISILRQRIVRIGQTDNATIYQNDKRIIKYIGTQQFGMKFLLRGLVKLR